VAVISALPPLALQAGANRVVQGVAIEHVCGDPSLPPDADRALRRSIVEQGLRALTADVQAPTVFGGAG